LNGLIKPDTGSIEMRGRIGALIALGAGFNPILTGRENIYINGSVLGLSKREIDAKLDEIIDFAEIGDFIDTPVQNYSSGMTVRLGFAIASTIRPEILLLDEVLAVGDMGFAAKCFSRVGELRSQNSAVIIVSHNMHNITRFCDKVMYLKNSTIADFGETSQVVSAFTRDQSGRQFIRSIGGQEIPAAGSERLKITHIKTTSMTGEELSCIDLNQDIRLMMDYDVPIGSVKPVIEVIFRDNAGNTLIHLTNRTCNVDLGYLSGQGVITLEIPKFNLNCPELKLSLVIWDESMTELIYWTEDYRISVSCCSLSIGAIFPQVAWAVHRSE
jgi:lipopolysaccharide transport system ATP-binding protein